MTRDERKIRDDERRVAPLSDLNDWELKDGEPDVRGWEVVTDRGQRVGEVQELLADPSARRVRYLEVEIDGRDETGIDRRIAFPIGTASIEEDNRRVRLTAAQTPTADLPRYRGGVPDRAYEQRVAKCFGCDAERMERFDHPAYDDRSFYRR